MLLEELPLELPPLILRPLFVASPEVERHLAMNSNELGDLRERERHLVTISSASRQHPDLRCQHLPLL